MHQLPSYHENDKYFEATTQIYFSLCTRSRLKYFLINLIYSALFSQPHQPSYFFLNFGPISAWASYKAYSYKKKSLLVPHGAQAFTVFSYPLLYYYYFTIFSKYSTQTSQIQFLEEVSTWLCVGVIPYRPHTLHTDEMTPPPPLHCTAQFSSVLDCTLLFHIPWYRSAVLCNKYIYHNMYSTIKWLLVDRY